MLLEIFPKIYSILITCLFFNTLLKSLKEKSYVLSGSHVADKTKTIKIKPMSETQKTTRTLGNQTEPISKSLHVPQVQMDPIHQINITLQQL